METSTVGWLTYPAICRQNEPPVSTSLLHQDIPALPPADGTCLMKLMETVSQETRPWSMSSKKAVRVKASISP